MMIPKKKVEPIAVKVSTAAAMVDVNRVTIYNAIWRGTLPAYRAKEGGEMKVLVADLTAWIKSQAVKPSWEE